MSRNRRDQDVLVEVRAIGGEINALCVHSLRATAATNALSHEADIDKV
jgi:hypothetical protein